ncbi:MAG: peptidoglycan DD-metalloendopeptidase family protein [Pseudomonadota bacterium]
MSLARDSIRAFRPVAAVIGLAIVAGACAKPAKVVLYEQRQQMAQHGVRDVQAPVSRGGPETRTQIAGTSAHNRRAPVPPARPGGAIEVSKLPPPPPRRPGVQSGDAGTKTSAQDTVFAARPTEPATRARSFEKTAAATPAERRIPAQGIHVVTPKQTVYALSRLYGVPVRSLLILNKLKPPYLLQTGQKVKIPVQRTHMVSKGETVYAISRRYNVSIAELVRLNGIGKPPTIVTGQTLLLPDEQRTAIAAAVRASPEAEAAGDAEDPGSEEQVASIAPPPKRVLLPPSTNIPQPKRLSRSGFLWPVKGKVISRFGAKGKGLRNDGINIAAPKGSPIRAAQNGVVAYRGNELRGFGNLILIKHDKGYMTAYAHASKVLVKRGERVKRGQVIARVGNTGSVASSQLHFEIRRGRRPIDPMRHLRSDRAEIIVPSAPKPG